MIELCKKLARNWFIRLQVLNQNLPTSTVSISWERMTNICVQFKLAWVVIFHPPHLKTAIGNVPVSQRKFKAWWPVLRLVRGRWTCRASFLTVVHLHHPHNYAHSRGMTIQQTQLKGTHHFDGRTGMIIERIQGWRLGSSDEGNRYQRSRAELGQVGHHPLRTGILLMGSVAQAKLQCVDHLL